MIYFSVLFLLMYDIEAKPSNFGAVMAPGQQQSFWSDIVFRNKGEISMPQILMPDCPTHMRCVIRNFCSDSMLMTHEAENSLSFQSDDRGFLSCVMKHVPMLGVCCREPEESSIKNHTTTMGKELILVDSALLKEMPGTKPKAAITPRRFRQRPTPLPKPRFKKPTASAARLEMSKNIPMKRFKEMAEHLSFSSLIHEDQSQNQQEIPITTRRPNIPHFVTRKPKQNSMVVINVNRQQLRKPKSKEIRSRRPGRLRKTKPDEAAILTRFNQRYPEIQDLFLRNLLDLLELQEQKHQKQTTSSLRKQPEVFISCPAAMKCVQRNRCDMKGWMTDNPRAEILKFTTKSVPLIVCDDPNSNLEDTVCCRDPHYKEESEDYYDYSEAETNTESDNYDYDYETEMEELDSDLGVKALLDVVLREEIIEIAALERERRKVQKQLEESRRDREKKSLKVRFNVQ